MTKRFNIKTKIITVLMIAVISSYSNDYIRNVQNFINSYPCAIFNGEGIIKRFNRELKRLNTQKNIPFLQITP